MNKEDYKLKLISINKKIDSLEKELDLLKKESDSITLELINDELNKEPIIFISEEDKKIIDYLEQKILEYDTTRKSSFIAKAIDSKGIKLFASLNDMNEEDEKEIKSIIDNLLLTLVNAGIDEGYIASIDAAKRCSFIVNGLSTFSMIVIVKEKTYAFAEGKSNIYTYIDGKINKFDLINKYSELNYEVLNNDDYTRLVLLSKSDKQDFTDEKVKIITKKTNRDDLINELI